MNNKKIYGTWKSIVSPFYSHELTPTPLCSAKRGYRAPLPLLLLAREEPVPIYREGLGG